VAIYPSPFGYQDDKGVTHGVTPDLITAVTKTMGREVEFIHMTYLRAMHELKTGGIDMVEGINIPSTNVRLPPETITTLTPHVILPLSLYSLADRGIEINTQDQIKRYRIGTVRIIPTEQRSPWLNEGNTHYFEGANNLTKALLAKRIDLATLDPVSAGIISKQLDVDLSRVVDFNTLSTFLLFSPASPRIRNALKFCQDYVSAQIKIFDDDKYDAILKANNMTSLLRYYNQDYSPGCRIIPAE